MKKDRCGRKPRGIQPGSVRWHLERLQEGESYTVSRRVDGDAGKVAMETALRYARSRITSAAFRPTRLPGLKYEWGDYRTQSLDLVICMTATKMHE